MKADFTLTILLLFLSEVLSHTQDKTSPYTTVKKEDYNGVMTVCNYCRGTEKTFGCFPIPNGFLDGIGYYKNDWVWNVDEDSTSAMMAFRTYGRFLKFDWK